MLKNNYKNVTKNFFEPTILPMQNIQLISKQRNHFLSVLLLSIFNIKIINFIDINNFFKLLETFLSSSFKINYYKQKLLIN